MSVRINWKNNKPFYVEATYTTSLGFSLEELPSNLNWDNVEMIWCKYGTLTISMKDGEEHTMQYSSDMESDYKWPISLKMYDKDYDELWSENERERVSKDTDAHDSGKCPVCLRDNIGYFEDDAGVLRQCFDCGSEWNDSMEITINARSEE